MITYPSIDPIAFHLFSWPVHWYGLMYLIGFLGGWAVLSLRLRYSPWRGFNQEAVTDIVFYTALGVIIGGRLGYIVFYDWHAIFSNPAFILQVWKGGMSFHGGLLGVLVAMWLCTKKFKKSFLQLTDLISPAVPIGLGAGRIGNFINSELWGRVSDVPWAMVFPGADSLPRHPSQLYEFFFEGVVLFTVLWIFSRKPRPVGAVSGLFALLYAIFRFSIEFYREPDWNGFVVLGMTEGQWLSLPLALVGVLLLWYAYRSKRTKRART